MSKIDFLINFELQFLTENPEKMLVELKKLFEEAERIQKDCSEEEKPLVTSNIYLLKGDLAKSCFHLKEAILFYLECLSYTRTGSIEVLERANNSIQRTIAENTSNNSELDLLFGDTKIKEVFYTAEMRKTDLLRDENRLVDFSVKTEIEFSFIFFTSLSSKQSELNQAVAFVLESVTNFLSLGDFYSFHLYEQEMKTVMKSERKGVKTVLKVQTFKNTLNSLKTSIDKQVFPSPLIKTIETISNRKKLREVRMVLFVHFISENEIEKIAKLLKNQGKLTVLIIAEKELLFGDWTKDKLLVTNETKIEKFRFFFMRKFS